MQDPNGTTTETVAAGEARERWNELLSRVSHRRARVIVEEGGAPIAVLLPFDDLARLDRLDAERAKDFRILDEMQAAFEGTPEEEIEREAAKALAEARAEMRAERATGGGDRR